MALQWRHDERNGVSIHQRFYCLFNRLFRHWSKKTSKTRVTGLCEGNPPVTGGFPSQRVSNAENVSIWWRHLGLRFLCFVVVMQRWVYPIYCQREKGKQDRKIWYINHVKNIATRSSCNNIHLSFRAIHYELQICHPVSLHHNYRDRWLLSVVLYALIRRVICKIMQNTDYLQNNTKYEEPRKHTSAAPTLRSLKQSSHGRSKIYKKNLQLVIPKRFTIVSYIMSDLSRWKIMKILS